MKKSVLIAILISAIILTAPLTTVSESKQVVEEIKDTDSITREELISKLDEIYNKLEELKEISLILKTTSGEENRSILGWLLERLYNITYNIICTLYNLSYSLYNASSQVCEEGGWIANISGKIHDFASSWLNCLIHIPLDIAYKAGETDSPILSSILYSIAFIISFIEIPFIVVLWSIKISSGAVCKLHRLACFISFVSYIFLIILGYMKDLGHSS